MEIKYFNRESGQLEVEKVYGDAAVKWMYESASGKLLSRILVKAPLSIAYGQVQNMFLSKGKIAPFIKNFDINMDEYLPQDGMDIEDPYTTFNNFFIRKFKDGKRNFVEGSQFPAPAEARYFGYESINSNEVVPVKGDFLSPEALISNPKWNDTFKEGPLLLARLCPVDYHRFHYPDNGKIIERFRVAGALHSVNPLALKAKPDVLVTNERQVTILETENFGKVAYIEVGAMCVGKIVHSAKGEEFSRGDEKGYFLFGGSTVIVVGEKGKWKPSQDLITNTKNGNEVYLKLGNSAGEKITN